MKLAIEHHRREGNDSPIGQRGICKDLLALSLLKYTAGRPIEDVADIFGAMLSWFGKWQLDYVAHAQRLSREMNMALREDATPVDFSDLEDFQDALTIASIAVLLGNDGGLSLIVDSLRRYRGEDLLFDALVSPVIGAEPAGTEFFHEVPYDPLIDAFYTARTPDEASAFVKRYLQGWYKAFDGCSWHDGHLVQKDHMSPYNGYWAFEAAAICVIHGIDDSGFRDHIVYPKDLADWARSNDSVGKLRACAKSSPALSGLQLRCEAGQPCPHEGVWSTPADPAAQRHFAVGERMPELRSDYGVTIWQLDTRR